MCTIMGFSRKTLSEQEIAPFLARTASRGPDMSRIVETPSGWLCFQRLAIMGLTEAGEKHRNHGNRSRNRNPDAGSGSLCRNL